MSWATLLLEPDDPNNVIKTDIVEINIKNKNTKLMMYDKENKVSIENRN